MRAAGLEEGERSEDVRLVVDARDLDRGADAGAGREVDDGVEAAAGPLGLEDAGDGRGVGNVGPLEPEPLSREEAREAPLLEADVVGVVEVVDADDGIAPAEEPFADGRADEARAARDEDALYNPNFTPPRIRRSLIFQLSPLTAAESVTAKR